PAASVASGSARRQHTFDPRNAPRPCASRNRNPPQRRFERHRQNHSPPLPCPTVRYELPWRAPEARARPAPMVPMVELPQPDSQPCRHIAPQSGGCGASFWRADIFPCLRAASGRPGPPGGTRRPGRNRALAPKILDVLPGQGPCLRLASRAHPRTDGGRRRTLLWPAEACLFAKLAPDPSAPAGSKPCQVWYLPNDRHAHFHRQYPSGSRHRDQSLPKSAAARRNLALLHQHGRSRRDFGCTPCPSPPLGGRRHRRALARAPSPTERIFCSMSTPTVPTRLDTHEILADRNAHRLTLHATLVPVAGSRFQPAGFPEVGHVIYPSPQPDGSVEQICIVDSAASMANHLESVCMSAPKFSTAL